MVTSFVAKRSMNEMTPPAGAARASAIRCEAAALRRDIHEAQFLIDRLERRYLNGNGHAQPNQIALVLV